MGQDLYRHFELSVVGLLASFSMLRRFFSFLLSVLGPSATPWLQQISVLRCVSGSASILPEAALCAGSW